MNNEYPVTELAGAYINDYVGSVEEQVECDIEEDLASDYMESEF